MKNRNSLNLSKSLPGKLLLTLALIIGGGNLNFAWGVVDNGDGTLTEDFTNYSRAYSSSSGDYSITTPDGWYAYPSSVSYSFNNVASTSNYYHSASKAVFSSASNTENYIITPILTGNFKVWMLKYSSGTPSVTAYKCTYENNIFTLGTQIGTVTPGSTYSEYEFTNTENTRVALLVSYAYIDDFTYTPYYAVGENAAPTGLTASNAQPTSVDLSWTAGGEETTWQLSYGTTSGSLDNKSGFIATKPYTLSGLTPNTTYYVAVRALNGTYSTWSSETSFTTTGATAVTGVTVSPTATEILAGATTTLTATITPADATDQTVTWTSSNTSVATVSDAGVVTAIAPGEAIIKVTSNDNNEAQATCTITVTAPVTPTDLKAKDLTTSYVNLTWTNGSSESTWQIKYGTSSNNLSNTSGDITSSKKPYLITGLTSCTTYYASIRSKLGTAYSDWSDPVSFTTPAIGAAAGGATEETEDFESGWTVNANNNLSSIKNGWSYYSGYSSHQLSTTYRNGDSGYGLIAGYNSTQYLIMPPVKVGSTINFYCCKASTFSYASATVKLYKVIKVGSTYYLDTNVIYANEAPTLTTMSQYTSSTITEGGYVAIQLYNAGIDDITYQAATTVSAITDNNGYATFASSEILDLTTTNLPSGLEAYKAKVDGTTVKFTQLDQSVPASTGVLLKGNAYTEYHIATAAGSTEVSDNDFEVNSTGYTFDATSGYTYYGLKKNSDPLVFGTFDPASVAIPSNKAYLKVANSSARELTCTFGDDDVTAIGEVKANGQDIQDAAFYNLNGQRVALPTKGLYIINGKKMVVK